MEIGIQERNCSSTFTLRVGECTRNASSWFYLRRLSPGGSQFDSPMLRGVADGIYDLVKEHFFEDDSCHQVGSSIPHAYAKELGQVEDAKLFSKASVRAGAKRKVLQPLKILFLTANPQGSPALRLENELRRVKDGLASSTNRDRFSLESEPAVQISTITKAMQRIKPNIIHFSGHGAGEDGLVVEDIEGNIKILPTDGIHRLFKLFKEQIQCVECVVLNACYSKEQASLISKHEIFVVGMNSGIRDKAAIDFSVGFYESLGEGNNYEFAFEIAMVNLSPNLHDAETPELWYNGEIIKN